MGDTVCFLILVLYEDRLIDCALEVKKSLIGDDCCAYPMEPESRKKLHALLPMQVRSCGPIVDVREIFAVKVVGEVPGD